MISALLNSLQTAYERDYATYVGGSGNEMPQSLVVDGQGNLIIAGRTTSKNYPTTGVGLIGPGSLDAQGNPNGTFDIVITKLNAAGNALIGSKKIGGSADDGANITPYGGNSASSLMRNYGDEARSEVNLDGFGNIYLSSCSQSDNFPTVNPVQSSKGGKQDAVVLKFDPTVTNLLFSTYLGGTEDDATYVVSINPLNGNIYVAGGTASNNLPGPRAGTISSNIAGSIDGFVSILAPDGSALLRQPI